jgi:hypothetical protein
MKKSLVVGALLVLFSIESWRAGGAWGQMGTCAGDCNHDDRVAVDELVTGVNMALGAMPIDRCPDLAGGDNKVGIDELIAAVNNALVGCGTHVNRAPQASEVSFTADTATPYLEKQLIGSDPDNDTITYELVGDDTGTGYQFAYVNPESGVLYLTLAPDFEGTIVLPYRVTDGKLFSNTAAATVQAETGVPSRNTGLNGVDAKEYGGFPRGFYDGARLGAPGADPTLPSAVDLSKDFPRPGDQGNQSSCVGWASAYALKTYQERVETGWSLEAAEHRFSPAYIYNQINRGQDHGSWIDDALNLIVDQGVATLAQTPYDDRDFLTQPSAAARQEASEFKGLRWKTANGVLEIKDALANRLPVVVAVWVYEDMQRLRGPDSVYNTFGGALKGKHAVTITGYDDQRYGGAFRIINSWGQGYGDGGYFWLPYTVATQVINTYEGPQPVLLEAYVLEDMRNATDPVPDPVDPKPVGQLPDLQVTNWSANFNGAPGGSGSLQYTVTNTGTATAPAGAYVALTVSPDPTFATNSLVVYEKIPFDVAPGTTAYRDQNNSIAFNFPYDLQPGQYYMAFKADIFNDVVESNEDDNFSPATAPIDIVSTLPDLEVLSWYATWDELGLGTLTYNVANNGESVAPAGWRITLALSPNNTFGDGDETFLFSEPANFDVNPGGTLYRNDSSAAGFSLYFDVFGNEVPDGEYYIGLWLDPNASLAESNEFNNASLSWGTIRIGVGGSDTDTRAQLAAESSPVDPAEAYNGKILPTRQAAARSVRITTASQGRRVMEFLGEEAVDDAGPSVKAADAPRWSKTARARQQVIFPVTDMKPMPSS